MKLHSSPTHAVLVPLMTMWSRFFMKLMTAPYTGPSANAPSRAGRSEKSILTKDGMSIGMGNSMNIRMKATALSMAATVRLWVVFFFIGNILPSGRFGPKIELESPFRAVSEPGRQPKTRPAATKHCNRARRQFGFVCRFLHPDYTVGPGVSPGQHSLGVVAGCTASGESHPALKRTFWPEYSAADSPCQAPVSVALSARFMVYWGVKYFFRGVLP